MGITETTQLKNDMGLWAAPKTVIRKHQPESQQRDGTSAVIFVDEISPVLSAESDTHTQKRPEMVNLLGG